MKYGLTQKQLQEIQAILGAQPEIQSALLFGSRALDTYKEASDIDLAIKGSLGSKTLMQLKDAFVDSNLPFFVDLVDYERITEPALKKHIDAYGICIYGEGEGIYEWREYFLEDVIEKFIDYRGKTPQKTVAGIPLVTAKVVKAGKILPPNEFIAPEDYDSWMTRGLPEIDDVVLTTEAPLGEVALIKDKNIALAQRIITLRGKRDLLFNPFLKFYFQNETGQHELQSRSSGTTVFGIKASVLKKVPIELPPLPVQKSIAAVLSSLDDKIDLLHRQNQTLEAMAATLFRQWFVEESQERFEEIPLEQFFDFMEGPGIRNWQYTESGTPFINIRLISNGDIDISKASFVSNEEANGKYSHFHLKEGDMIVSTSGTLGRNAIVRSYHLPLILNTSVIRFRPRDGRSYSFVYQYLNSRLFQEHLESAASGSVQANFGPTHLKQMTLSKPPQDVLDKYLLQADRLYDKLRVNQAQIKTLEKLRDNLLPKLMSGEVRVSHA